MGNVDRDFALISPNISLVDVPLPRRAKLGILASGSGSNYGAIAAAIEAGELNADIPVLICNKPRAKVLERAAKFGTKTQLLNHREFDSREALDEAILACFREHGVEWVIMAGWMRIVTDVLLKGYENRILNIHPSILPSFKGIRAIEQALAAQVKVTGCSVHFASLEVDSGEIVMQAAVPIAPNDTAETLHARIQAQEHRIFPTAIALAIRDSEQ
ncbi:formyltetrahydrofolate-dependent phosphoribosylglycinamide formyltransferase [[Leptolyngbya] sp. PCC 7376]|uniref:phosphoribosylglycinamide formyltransferase n=1 Tax=[Leptolyngbya] sp. PCC 7376 TaxID=111781 RepID=UPI00029EFC80|nr:phosphoribosylglycinamide formyltransferase [[Leptolyngbya] sp. PCC 7376]AFY38076.1 formyltetrahydrofolate-dependent phosphoribosylglycinamide formyltransferase [[Leptolyngbya] sp. PCC 7376]